MGNTRLIVYAALLWTGLAGSARAGYRSATQGVTRTLALCAVVIVTLAGCAADDPVCRESMGERALRAPGPPGAALVANLFIEIGCGLQGASQERETRIRKQEADERYEKLEQETHKRRGELLARAQQGNVEARFELGHSSDDPSERRKWLCLAANQGHEKARIVLGVGKEFGYEPFERDYAESYMWYTLAMAQGNEWAANNRARVASKMTPEQIAEAKKQAADWQPNPKACESLAAQLTTTK